MKIKPLNLSAYFLSLLLSGFSSGSLLFSSQLAAQDTEDFDVWDNVSESMDLLTEMEHKVRDLSDRELLVRIGVVGGVAAEYRGSDQYEFSYAPNIKIVWNDFLFIKERKLGVQFLHSEHFYGGAFVRYTGGRSDSNEGLEGLGDISRTFTSGAYLNYRYEDIRLKTEIRHDFFDEGHGTMAIASLGSGLPWGDPYFYLAVQTSWVSKEYMNTFFGINRFQAMRSGLSQYSADSGFQDVSLSVSSSYKIDSHWSVSAQLQYVRLLGDAADSPIVRDIGSENNFIAGLGLNYTF